MKVEEGPRRRSGRLLGMEATEEVLQERAIEEEKKMEEIRIINRKTRDQVMKLGDMLEDAEEGEKESLVSYLFEFGAQDVDVPDIFSERLVVEGESTKISRLGNIWKRRLRRIIEERHRVHPSQICFQEYAASCQC